VRRIFSPLVWRPIYERGALYAEHSHESATNFLDLIAFVLITPEVLGQDTANKIREVIKVFNDSRSRP
jgi:hypothetical protein